MPTVTDENGNKIEFTDPQAAQEIVPVNIISSNYIDAYGVMALAYIAYGNREKWVAYCPSDIAQSYGKIRDAFAAGVLTGQIDPTPWTDTKTLAHAKAEKIGAIDAKTSSLIMSGFEYGANRFSMSEAAQRNWIGLGTMASLGMMQYPMPVSTVTEGVAYIQSLDDLRGFLAAFTTYQTAPNGPLGSGRALKAQVNAAQTIAEVDAIQDAR